MSAHWYQAPIVLVENDPNDVFFVQHALEQARIRNPLTVCASADEARRAIAMPHGVPIIMILDIGLAGGETGLDFLRWLREQPPPLGTTPTMMLTGSHQPDDYEAAMAYGAVAFLLKPVTEQRLADAVQALGFVVVTSAVSGELGFRIIEPR
jgi:DNA-binding NarL/FixJ family response regulator